MNIRTLASLCLTTIFLSSAAAGAHAQTTSSYNRQRAEDMLAIVIKDVEKNYYDPTFHNIDLKQLSAKTKQSIETADSFNLAMAHIAQALMAFNDSHTFLVPPPRPYILHYGFEYQMIGNRCFIIRVRPGSDALTKGLKPGDELLKMAGFPPTRANLWMMRYRYNTLRPEPDLLLDVREPEGQLRQIDVKAEMQNLQRVRDLTGNDIWDLVRQEESESHRERARGTTAGDDVTIIKITGFNFEQSKVEAMMKEARNRPALILDLRENEGGAVDSLKYMLGGIFDKEVKIADRVGRKESKPEIAKSAGSRAFLGKLIVLVDSDSASAAELFARVVQLEKRGVVMGDQTSGAVMEARYFSEHLGMVTIDDLIMSDGKSLEHTGVTPDVIALPSADDLSAGRDPVLAKAVETLGGKISPENAGRLFPYEWSKY